MRGVLESSHAGEQSGVESCPMANLFGVGFIGYVKRKLSDRKAKKQAESPADRAARRTAVATIWMAIFTFVLAGTSGFTIWILKNQLHEMHEGGIDTHALAEATGDAANAATDQADAAQQFSDTAEDINGGIAGAVDQLEATAQNAKAAIQATRDAMRLEQRAWVGLTVVDVPKPLPTGATFEIVNHFSNTGKTPALRAHAVSELEIDVHNLQPIYKESDAPEGPPLLPGAEVRGSWTAPILNEETVKAIKDGSSIIYDRGAVWYWDVFGRKHVTTFCLAYNVASGAFHADSTIPCRKQEAN